MNIKFRPLTKECIPYRIKWFSNPRVVKFLGFENPNMRRTKKTEGNWFDEYEKRKKKGEAKYFAICEDKKPIGMVGYCNISRVNRKCELFILVGDDAYVGKGIGEMAMRFIIDYSFKELKIHKIKIGVFKENKPALELYKKMGFKIEGINKDESFFDGKYHDLYNMAIFNKKK